MKVLILAGAITALGAPFAFADETTTECQLDDARRTTHRHTDVAPTAKPDETRPTLAERAADPPPPVDAQRRRSGNHVPDAELIGRRGAL